jgi:hypothetical protein
VIIEETPEGKVLVDAWFEAQDTFNRILSEISSRQHRAFLPESREALIAELQMASADKDQANQELIEGLTALQQASGDKDGVPEQETVAESAPGADDSATA